jgi:hypothetical protein
MKKENNPAAGLFTCPEPSSFLHPEHPCDLLLLLLLLTTYVLFASASMLAVPARSSSMLLHQLLLLLLYPKCLYIDRLMP